MLYIIFEQKMGIFIQDEWSDRKFNARIFRPFAFQKPAVSSTSSIPLFSSATAVVVSMEMCVQNLYPRRSPELPGNSRKALVELRATKERLRCESFPIPRCLPPSQPSDQPLLQTPLRSRASHGPGPCIPVCRCRKTGKRISPRKCRGNGYIRALSCVPPRLRTTRVSLQRHSRIYTSQFTLIPRRETLSYSAD